MEQRTWIGEVALHELSRSLRENGALLRIDESEWKSGRSRLLRVSENRTQVTKRIGFGTKLSVMEAVAIFSCLTSHSDPKVQQSHQLPQARSSRHESHLLRVFHPRILVLYGHL